LLGMVMHSLPADVIKNPLIHLVPVKGARAAGEGRIISLASASARALAVYLRARRHHKLADSDWVWLGTRNRGRLQETGLRLMLVRRVAPSIQVIGQVNGQLPAMRQETQVRWPRK
jgi:hypothetical protein